MAFDLEEQEQLAELKHFWKQYGNWILGVVLVVALAFAGWTGWRAWQNNKAAQAMALYEEIERIATQGAAEDKDGARLTRALADMKDKFGSTAQAQQAALLVAAAHAQAGRPEAARAALQWLAEDGKDDGFKALARLRLAGLLLDAKSYDEALKQLDGKFPEQFAPLAADRKGDVYLAQGKKTQAGDEYRKALQGLEGNYRQVVDAKLAALGLSADAPAAEAGK
jgi:predicted negative regulator of RcsB-dependent stress response